MGKRKDPKAGSSNANDVNETIPVSNNPVNPTKSRFGPRIYQKGKPHPWGYKIYSLADRQGVTYKLNLHTGKFPEVPPHPNLGSTNNRVFWSAQSVPSND